MAYWERKQKLSARIVVDERYPTLKVTFSAWKFLRYFTFSAYMPAFVDVQPLILIKLQEALKMLANHAASLNDGKGVGGGLQGIIVDQNENYFKVRVFPRSDQYYITIQRDEFGAVAVNVPAIKFTDIPSINQTGKVMGQCMQLAKSLGG